MLNLLGKTLELFCSERRGKSQSILKKYKIPRGDQTLLVTNSEELNLDLRPKWKGRVITGCGENSYGLHISSLTKADF